MNNKELVNAGHELAKAISNDMPLIEIAKMVSNLATQLDVQIARSHQLSIALEAAEKRIAELEAKLANPVMLPKTNGYWDEKEKAYEEAITLAKRQVRLAGFCCEGDE
ncbi:hypothetical protein ACSQX3_002007 [Enterobacter hormaechei]|uniref:hypothetical protein n=1 Tax=Enterobacter hormaechei TaxID=158836 RepID=UPI002FF0005B